MSAISMQQIINKYKESHPEVREFVEVAVGEGAKAKPFRVKHPVYRTNEENRAIARAANGSTSDLVKAILGDKEYERFVGAGGEDNTILMLLQLIQENDLPSMAEPDAEGKPQTD